MYNLKRHIHRCLGLFSSRECSSQRAVAVAICVAEHCCQNMANLIVFPTGDFQVYLWMLHYGNIVLLTVRVLDVVKFTALIPLS
jgi:hypothetical protein